MDFPFLENRPMTILQIMKLLHHSQGYSQYTFIQTDRTFPHQSQWSEAVWGFQQSRGNMWSLHEPTAGVMLVMVEVVVMENTTETNRRGLVVCVTVRPADRKTQLCGVTVNIY